MTNIFQCFQVGAVVAVIGTGAVVGTETLSKYSELSELVGGLAAQVEQVNTRLDELVLPEPPTVDVEDLSTQLGDVRAQLAGVQQRLAAAEQAARDANERSSRIALEVFPETQVK